LRYDVFKKFSIPSLKRITVRTKIIRPLFSTLFLITLFSCGSKTDNKSPGGRGGAGGPQQIKDYAVLTLAPRSATIHYDFPATIQGQQVIEIRPKVDGYIGAIYVNEGAAVKKGQLLFKISNPQYEQEVRTAQASIKSAIADVNAAQMDVAKVRPLVEKDIVSKYELESAQYTLQAREAALSQARAALANAQANLGYTYIRAPESGVIGTIPYKIGALVNSSTPNPLTTLSNTGNVYAYYSLNEKQLLNFISTVPGATLQDKLKVIPPVTLVLANGTEYPEKGRLETASGLITTETGTASFKATFPNPMGIIQSGASATVRVPRTVDSALMIPQSATYELQDKQFAYVLGDSNKVVSTAITTQPTNDGQFFIVQQGLKAGDKVVIEGVATLKDGMAIKPRPVNADSVYNRNQLASF
jgi:membrane fusion protein, multidrug efflux system